MKTSESILWFKTSFLNELPLAVAGTPFSVDLLAAIAYQETGYIWSVLVEKGLPLDQVLRLCVGDTIDAPGRSAFPKTKQELLSLPKGQQLFDIARQSLVDMAQHIAGYQNVVTNSSKFCHGFGIFQCDLQFAKTRADYFLNQAWGDMKQCLQLMMEELKAAQARQGWSAKTTLTDFEKIHIAIAYNRGKSTLSKGFKQGYFDGQRYYGEYIQEYLATAQSIQVSPVPVPLPDPGPAPIPSPTPIESGGEIYRVNVSSVLKLRMAPDTSAGVRASLPAGQLVRRIGGLKTDSWYQVETSVNGAYFTGFAFAQYLDPMPAGTTIPVVVVSDQLPTTGAVAVYCPREPGTVTKRTDPAGARSLNEPGMPSRTGDTAQKRVQDIAAILDWLDVENPANRRYQPGNGSTFCNVYAHDFCMLAGAYLPRVWWTGSALLKLGQGQQVPVLIGDTIDEQRANDIFRWLKSFGPAFGWRETGTFTKLQEAANLGAVCIIIARRKDDGKSGHVDMVVPESDAFKAVRGTTGEVTTPLQSQAGRVNFKYGRGDRKWWEGDEFADYALWMHA